MNENIDFIVTWVDDNDLAWQDEKRRWSKENKQFNTDVERYRDWGLLKYWFRGVEKFAPWVHKVYLVTCGQQPDWLNVECEKLVCVNHSDYMNPDSLPTFNSNAIEIGLHRIRGLSDCFVLFNDDMYIINNMAKTDFFENGLPCDFAALDSIIPDNDFCRIRINDTRIINQFFDKREVLKTYSRKWYNFKDVKADVRTFFLDRMWYKFTGFRDYHIPISYKKNDFIEVWNEIPELLSETECRKFRSGEDYSHWLFRYWRNVKGKFEPTSQRKYAYLSLKTDDVTEICDVIRQQRKKMICINDEYNGENFDRTKQQLLQSFEAILPEKSIFEILLPPTQYDSK